MPLLSIIIPVYNSERYLEKCLKSILVDQDINFEDIEIILINDGSPDNCSIIIENYQKQYNNIIQIFQVNQGTSEARNTGIRNAKGEFLMFVDPDDYLMPKILSQLIKIMIEDNLDMLRTDFSMINEYGELMLKPQSYAFTFDDEINDGLTFLKNKLGYTCYVWAFIYKRSLIIDNQIFFQKGFYIDDVEWIPRILSVAKRVKSNSLISYNYVQRNGSLMNSATFFNEKKLNGLLQAIALFKKKISETNDIQLINWYAEMSTILTLTSISDISKVNFIKRIHYLKRINKFSIKPMIAKSDYPLLKKKVRLSNISIYLYSLILQLSRSVKSNN